MVAERAVKKGQASNDVKKTTKIIYVKKRCPIPITGCIYFGHGYSQLNLKLFLEAKYVSSVGAMHILLN
jgi:hypothetical protein